MNFRDLSIPNEIYTTDQNPIKTFFIPLLSVAKEYKVAVGYFSSVWFKNAAAGVASLAENEGKSKWLINPELSEDDWSIFDDLSGDNRISWIINKIDESINNLFELLESDTRETIAWLIHNKTLEFKIAIPKSNLSGIFHPKIGVFSDFEGNKIAFTGSYNLTGGAAFNWEHIEIFKSWEDNHRVISKQNKFENMWDEKDSNLSIYLPSDKSIRKIVSYRKNVDADTQPDDEDFSPKIPHYYLKNDNLRKHQEDAISAWFQNNGRGIYHMATGSGKTVTALATATRLYNFARSKDTALGIIVTVPYKHLADQWEKEAKAFGFDPIICYGNYKKWIDIVSNVLLDYKMNIKDNFFFITSNATFQKNKFQTYLSKMESSYLFIADEMHNLGGEKIKETLPLNAKFRLGLSATPDRHYDSEGTELLKDYFGDIIIEYGIEDAINDNTLCKYFYHPIIVELTPEENDNYIDLSKSISTLYHNEELNEERIKLLLLKRSRLIANADNKIVELIKLLHTNSESSYNLIYCGDEIEYDLLENDLDDDVYITAVRQVEKILQIVGLEIGMKASKFTAVESMEKRQQILSLFASGDLHALIAIRCLDEGVDVPRTETAYILASTSNPRQFIQRRGRVLRNAKGKKHATIYDFIVIPHDVEILHDDSFNIERNLIKKELTRVKEFAEISMNPGETLKLLREYKEKFNLLYL